MKERIRIFPMKAISALSLLLSFSSLFLLLGRYFLPENRLLWYLFPVGTFIWSLLGYLFPGKIRAIWVGTGMALLLAAAWLVIAPISAAGITLAIPCAAMMILLPLGWGRPLWSEWHMGIWAGGVILHLIAYSLGQREEFSGISGPLSLCFALYAFLLLMTLNRQGLRTGMHDREKAPPALRRRNRLLVVLLFLPALLASMWGLLGQWLDALWNGIRMGIGRVIEWLLSLFAREGEEMVPGAAEQEGDLLLGLGESAEPSELAKLLEKLAVYVAGIILIALAVFVCVFLYRQLRRLIRYLMERLRRYARAAGEDYEDETESTLKLDEKAQAFREKMQKLWEKGQREPAWQELSGREKIRRLYRRFMQKKPEIRGMTAREALLQQQDWPRERAEEFAALYEAARYSDHEVAGEAADRLREKMR